MTGSLRESKPFGNLDLPVKGFDIYFFHKSLTIDKSSTKKFELWPVGTTPSATGDTDLHK
jgi:hypothetical protein